jgi:hypothetical protein
MELKPWTTDRPVRSPFALPRGLAGHLAGRLMLLLNRQRDVLELLDVRPGASVLEVGYGPGGPDPAAAEDARSAYQRRRPVASDA